MKTYLKKYDTTVNINLKKDSGDDTNHYVQLNGWVLSFNSNADDYDTVNELVQTNDVYVDDIVKETIGSFTVSTIDVAKVKTEIIKKIQEKYNTKAIVSISLTDFLKV